MNHLTFKEIATELNELGINGISEEIIDRQQSNWDDSPESYKECVSKVACLLTEIGGGIYDWENWTWTPSSEDVYAFDVEFFNIETMYENFLNGVAAIGDGELDFSGIEENLEGVDWECGTGSRSVKFMWRGTEYALEAEAMTDWFDPNAANQLNQIIQSQGDGKQLYFGNDGYQIVYVFYCDAEWAAAFAEVTGMELTKLLK